jgi:magnesium transporter
LTLEDIVMQDPREKLEHFQRLGYYFVSFRAIESWQNRGKSWTRAAEDEADDDGLGEASVYLVVFKTGICIFHFTDISGELAAAVYNPRQLMAFCRAY